MSNKLERHQQKKLNHRGQSLIEMALMLPILLVLIITSIDVGRLFFTKTVITNAAREGAYYLSTHPEDYNSSTGTAPNTVLAAEEEASNSGVPEIIVSISEASLSVGGGDEGDEGDGGDEGDDGGDWWGGWGGWGGGGGWGWDGGCVCEEDEDETVDLQGIRVTVQTNVPDILFLGFIGDLFSLNATNYNEFPISSCVEMMVP
jgi:hypothetical protein